jgi:hypothetical protein
MKDVAEKIFEDGIKFRLIQDLEHLSHLTKKNPIELEFGEPGKMYRRFVFSSRQEIEKRIKTLGTPMVLSWHSNMEWQEADNVTQYNDGQRCVFCICGTQTWRRGIVRWVHCKVVWYEEDDQGGLHVSEYIPTHWYPIKDNPPCDHKSKVKSQYPVEER